jgi:hypothetical protein
MPRVGITECLQKGAGALRECLLKNHHQREKEEQEKKGQRRTYEKCSDGEAIPRGTEGLAVVDIDRSSTWHFENFF